MDIKSSVSLQVPCTSTAGQDWVSMPDAYYVPQAHYHDEVPCMVHFKELLYSPCFAYGGHLQPSYFVRFMICAAASPSS